MLNAHASAHALHTHTQPDRHTTASPAAPEPSETAGAARAPAAAGDTCMISAAVGG